MSSKTRESRVETTTGMHRPLQVRWEDLVALRHHEVALNLGLSAPWLAASLWAAQPVQSSKYSLTARQFEYTRSCNDAFA